MDGKSARDKILREFFNLITVQEYKQTTLRQLAEKCGMSKGHIGFYFQKKEEIMIALAQQGYTKSYALICKHCRADRQTLSAFLLHQLFMHYLGYCRETTYRFTAAMWENKIYLEWITQATTDDLYAALQKIGFFVCPTDLADACSFSTYGVYGNVCRSYARKQPYDYHKSFLIFMRTLFVQIGFAQGDAYVAQALRDFEALSKDLLLAEYKTLGT